MAPPLWECRSLTLLGITSHSVVTPYRAGPFFAPKGHQDSVRGLES